MYWLHHWASIWKLWEILEDIFLAFTCQWFIIQNKDLIANCWLNWQRGKQDGQTHSSWLWLTWGHSRCADLGRNNIHVLSQWNNPVTLMLPCVVTSELGTMCVPSTKTAIWKPRSLILSQVIAFIKAQEIQAYRFVFNVIHNQHANETQSALLQNVDILKAKSSLHR